MIAMLTRFTEAAQASWCHWMVWCDWLAWPRWTAHVTETFPVGDVTWERFLRMLNCHLVLTSGQFTAPLSHPWLLDTHSSRTGHYLSALLWISWHFSQVTCKEKNWFEPLNMQYFWKRQNLSTQKKTEKVWHWKTMRQVENRTIPSLSLGNSEIWQKFWNRIAVIAMK